MRSLLRAVDRGITSASGNRQWREFVIAEARRAERLGDPAEREAALQHARDYAFLINSVREHKVGGAVRGDSPAAPRPARARSSNAG